MENCEGYLLSCTKCQIMCIYQSLAISILPQWGNQLSDLSERALLSGATVWLVGREGCTTGTIFISISVISSLSCQYLQISKLFFKIMPTTRYTNPLPPATPPFEKGSYYYALEIGLAWHGIELVSRLVHHIRLIHPKTIDVSQLVQTTRYELTIKCVNIGIGGTFSYALSQITFG